MKRNIAIAAVTAAALVGGGTATALATTGDDDGARVTSVKVSAGDALASALREAPGTAVSAELDDEDGDDGERAAWEVDVLAGDGTWHSVRIDPSSGKVLGAQSEDEDDTGDTAEARAALKGTSVDAADAAQAAAGHGTVTSVELDDDGDHREGGAAWEVETRTSGKAEQDWRVDGKTGKVTADRPDDSGSDDSDGSDSGSDDSDGSDDD
ncbi:PepSY domain-containing protein [Streptomyces flaveolus]|uniref:PepSY domain-containing protein n=1 Tax=Streptomyces flaveolus TaxID=67297 RepID=UPI0033EEBCFA